MTSTSKLRVATMDAPGAAGAVCREVQRVVGLVPEVDLQEIEGAELLVELCLVGVEPPAPAVAASVRRGACGLDVLGAWAEPGMRRGGPAGEVPSVAGPAAPAGPDGDDPEAEVQTGAVGVAARALGEGVPTATWVAAGAGLVRGGAPHWVLAVPARSAGGPVVAVRRRRGYSVRFSHGDVVSVRAAMAGRLPAAG